jgi:transcriptional regulator with XRE-family HTH domain
MASRSPKTVTCVGRNIRAYRIARRLSQVEVCRRASVSPTYLSHVEIRGLIPSLPVGIRLAQVLGVRPEAFIVEQEKP